MATKPSEYAVNTFYQRKEDFSRQSRAERGFFGQRRPGSDILDYASYLSETGLERFEEFLISGQGWFEVDGAASTWVSRFGYWVQSGQGGLAIQFHDGATCWYPSLGLAWYYAMRGAASKGRFIHAFIYKKVGYQLI